jgi:hypothetical protein
MKPSNGLFRMKTGQQSQPMDELGNFRFPIHITTILERKNMDQSLVLSQLLIDFLDLWHSMFLESGKNSLGR